MDKINKNLLYNLTLFIHFAVVKIETVGSPARFYRISKENKLWSLINAIEIKNQQAFILLSYKFGFHKSGSKKLTDQNLEKH